MKTLFPKSALSRKSDTSSFFPYSLIYSVIRERRKPSRKQIRVVAGGVYLATKGSFKDKGLIRNHDMILISRSLIRVNSCNSWINN